MGRGPPRSPRIRNREGVVLAIATAVFLWAGEFSNSVLRDYIARYVETQSNPIAAAVWLVVVFLAYTPAFGSFLSLIAAWLFAQNEVSRGRFFLGLGLGLSLLGLLSKVALFALGQNWTLPSWLTSFTGLGVLTGVACQIVMGSHAMALKKRWRKLRKVRGKEGAGREAEERTSPVLPDH